ncbi:MAG: hypothetical protein WBP79_13160 [Candidatus Acidiferrales bacterium]
MKRIHFIGIILAIASLIVAPRAFAQDGSIQFAVRATPSSGVEEPVRGFPFYLLSKSFEEIRKEAVAKFPKPDMNAYIDTLKVSDELKAWMKKNHWVRFYGEDFIDKLKVDDVMNVPEFFSAYVERNSGDQTVVFPSPKYKLSDKAKDPAKYDRLVKEYHDAVRRFLVANPKSMAGIDLVLEDMNPANGWDQIERKSDPELHRMTLDLARSKYLVARAETDLQGQGSLRGIPQGTYWLTTLEVAATIGDARLRWDTPVTVRAGGVTNITLSNFNSIQAGRNSP